METFAPRDAIVALAERGITAPAMYITPAVAFPSGLFSERLAVVCDARTGAALGAQVAKGLQAECVTLPGVPIPDARTAAVLCDATASADMLVAVGSGTINDLCKYAAHQGNKPYVVFPTAPSMNGYVSANASLLINGMKQSVTARLPVAVVCVMEVLAAAPLRMIRAGLGDSLARPTAQADWLLSHYMRDTAYDPRPFAWLAQEEPALLAQAEALAARAPEAVATLIRVLLLSGLGMTLAGNSAPASGGEHMIVHAYEALFGSGDVLHGEAVGVAAVYMARLQARMLDDPTLIPPEITQHIRPVMLYPDTIGEALQRSGAPATLQALGWQEARYQEAIARAPTFRDRFTFLSLV